MKQRKNKWIDKLIVIAMILSLVVLVFYVYDRRVQECTHNPLVFAAALYEKNYPVEAIGTLLLLPEDRNAKGTTIFFNSNRTTVAE